MSQSMEFLYNVIQPSDINFILRASILNSILRFSTSSAVKRLINVSQTARVQQGCNFRVTVEREELWAFRLYALTFYAVPRNANARRAVFVVLAHERKPDICVNESARE